MPLAASSPIRFSLATTLSIREVRVYPIEHGLLFNWLDKPSPRIHP